MPVYAGSSSLSTSPFSTACLKKLQMVNNFSSAPSFSRIFEILSSVAIGLVEIVEKFNLKPLSRSES